MLRCAAPLVTLAKLQVRRAPRGLRALPLELFTKPSIADKYADNYCYYPFN